MVMGTTSSRGFDCEIPETYGSAPIETNRLRVSLSQLEGPLGDQTNERNAIANMSGRA